MASPGPDAAMLDPKPQPAMPDQELNGHAPAEEPTKPLTASTEEPQPELEPTPTNGSPAKELPTQQTAPSPKKEVEASLVNGNGKVDAQIDAGAATQVVETHDVAADAEPESTSVSPKPSELPMPVAESSAPTASTEAKEEPEPTKEASPKEESTDVEPPRAPPKSPTPPKTESEDIEMGDVTPSRDEKLSPVEATDEKPATETVQPATEPEQPATESAQPAETVEELTQDTDMTDAPTEKPAAALQHPDSGDAAPPSQDTAALPTSEVDLGPASMSQLTIETAALESPAETSPEVSMMDAPSAKIAREREDDMNEAPAPKRARTEPKDEEPSETIVADAIADPSTESAAATPEVPSLDMTALTNLTHWTDAETNERTISPYQRREIRKVIGRVKKTKAGANFRDSVQKLWPALWDSYIARIEKPMDLSELDRSVRDPSSPIETLRDFKVNLSLVFENALTFNGPSHGITAAAAQAVKYVWDDVVPIPVEEPARPKAVPKAKPVRESRAAATETAARRQSSGVAASSPADAAAPVADAEQFDDRRASTATEGDRPKRTVRAPKPKDIDYTTKPSRKKLKPELQFCDEVLTEIMHPKHHNINQWFLEPVDAEGLGIPTYHNVIKKPMDLGKVQQNLASGEISSLKDFDKNVRLVFDNCYKFNGPPDQGNPVAMLAKRLDDLYGAQMKNKDTWLAKHAAKAAAPAASASNASDDEDEEDEDGEDAGDGVVDKKEIEELQAKLDEETKKLNGMFVSGNQAMIVVQKGIVDMVQNALIKAAQDAHLQPKTSKAARKPSKGGKNKSSGAGGRKSISGASQSKKSGGSKKAAQKKNLTPAEKDAIANAINDLETSHLDRAIEIIKHDTGQNENTAGELELDIDQLSTEALSKLWELCKKALPGFAKDLSGPKSSPEANRSSAKQGAKAAAKSKKNKPMGAKEQEDKIAKLRALQNIYETGQSPVEGDGDGDGDGMATALTPTGDSSDDSDSEEE